MATIFSAIFGGAPKAAPAPAPRPAPVVKPTQVQKQALKEPPGPSKETVKAQEKQEKTIAKKEATEGRELRSTKAVLAARSGRGQGVTLNPTTGERGVTTSGKLGGG